MDVERMAVELARAQLVSRADQHILDGRKVKITRTQEMLMLAVTTLAYYAEGHHDCGMMAMETIRALDAASAALRDEITTYCAAIRQQERGG